MQSQVFHGCAPPFRNIAILRQPLRTTWRRYLSLLRIRVIGSSNREFESPWNEAASQHISSIQEFSNTLQAEPSSSNNIKADGTRVSKPNYRVSYRQPRKPGSVYIYFLPTSKEQQGVMHSMLFDCGSLNIHETALFQSSPGLETNHVNIFAVSSLLSKNVNGITSGIFGSMRRDALGYVDAQKTEVAKHRLAVRIFAPGRFESHLASQIVFARSKFSCVELDNTKLVSRARIQPRDAGSRIRRNLDSYTANEVELSTPGSWKLLMRDSYLAMYAIRLEDIATDISSFAYMIQEFDDKPIVDVGKMISTFPCFEVSSLKNAAETLKSGIPVLKSSIALNKGVQAESFSASTSEYIDPKDFMHPPVRGRKVIVVGDSGSPEPLLQNAALLDKPDMLIIGIHGCLPVDATEEQYVAKALEAARLASSLGARTLWITRVDVRHAEACKDAVARLNLPCYVHFNMRDDEEIELMNRNTLLDRQDPGSTAALRKDRQPLLESQEQGTQEVAESAGVNQEAFLGNVS